MFFTASDFKANMEMNKEDKKDKVCRLYNQLTFDYALPSQWVDYLATNGIATRREITDSFVWGYPKGCIAGQPYPLDYMGIWILQNLERFEAKGKK